MSPQKLAKMAYPTSETAPVRRNWLGTLLTGSVAVLTSTLLFTSLLRFTNLTPAFVDRLAAVFELSLTHRRSFWFGWLALRWTFYSCFTWWSIFALAETETAEGKCVARASLDGTNAGGGGLGEEFFVRRSERARRSVLGLVGGVALLNFILSLILLHQLWFAGKEGAKQWVGGLAVLISASLYALYAAAWTLPRFERFVHPWRRFSESSVASV